MMMERWIRLIAGTMILASLVLARFVSWHFLWVTAFVGANLFQSAITKWCLMEDILGGLGVKRCIPPGASPPAPPDLNPKS